MHGIMMGALQKHKQADNNELLEKDGGTKNCIYKD